MRSFLFLAALAAAPPTIIQLKRLKTANAGTEGAAALVLQRTPAAGVVSSRSGAINAKKKPAGAIQRAFVFGNLCRICTSCTPSFWMMWRGLSEPLHGATNTHHTNVKERLLWVCSMV